MKAVISFLIFLFSVSVFAGGKAPVTYHIDIKNWPDRDSIVSQLSELVASKACYDIKGKPVTPEADCHKFAWFKSNDVLKPYKKVPSDIKMVLAHTGTEMRIIMFKWDGKKAESILNTGVKFDKNKIKETVIEWTFK